MNIHINPFQIINIRDQNIVISEKGVTKVNSLPLSQALQKIRTSIPTIQSKENLNDIFNEHNLVPDEAFEFLDKILTIQKTNISLYFKNLIIAHERGHDFECLLSSEFDLHLIFSTFDDHLSDKIKNADTLTLIILTPYNHNKLRGIYYNIAKKHPKSGICVALRIGDFFYVSQPYIPEIGGPCHFCNLDKMKHTERVRPSINTWSSLLNFCTENQISVPEPPFSRLQEALATGLLVEKIKLWTCPEYGHRSQDNIMLASYVHLFNGHVTEEPVTHWQMCDCLRPLT